MDKTVQKYNTHHPVLLLFNLKKTSTWKTQASAEVKLSNNALSCKAGVIWPVGRITIIVGDRPFNVVVIQPSQRY